VLIKLSRIVTVLVIMLIFASVDKVDMLSAAINTVLWDVVNGAVRSVSHS
jgi:hypothetical protein